MQADWTEVPISELALGGEVGVAGGPFGSALGRKDYVERGVPVVRGAQLAGNGRFSHSDLVFVEEDKADGHRRNLAFPGDVVVTQRGTIGQVGLIPLDAPFERYLLSQSQMKITVDQLLADREFVYYALRSPATVAALQKRAISAGVPHINLAMLREFRIRVPPLSTQRRIASVLSAFDELIEVNARRIRLCNNIVRSLYREWFVRLRFPGHQEDGFQPTSTRAVPDGWSVGAVGDFLEVVGGGTPSKQREEYWRDGTIDWYTPSDLTRRRTRYVDSSDARITSLGLEKSSARLFPSGSVLMTSRATLGVLAITRRPAACNQGFIVIPPSTEVPPAFVYEWLASKRLELESIATGATFKEITKGAFKRFPFVRPPTDLLDAFHELVIPMSESIAAYERINAVLSRARDLLLPRIVTGRIDITDLELGEFISPKDA